MVTRTLTTNLPAVDELLFRCMRQDMPPAEAQVLVHALEARVLDWDAVCRIAARHGVAPLVYVNLRKCVAAGLEVPEPIMARFKGAMFAAVRAKEQNQRWLERVIGFFNEQQIEVMLLKGAALDIAVYDPAWYVTALDIDLLIRAEENEMPADVLATIWSFNDDGPFECNFSRHHDLCIDGLLRIDYPQLWRDARAVDVAGGRAYIMCPEDLLIAACINGCRKRYFQLKNLYGIRQTLVQFPDLDWDRLADKAQGYQCAAIVFAALQVARQTVAAPVSEPALDRIRPGAVRSRTIRFLVNRMSYASLSERSTDLEDQTRLRDKKLVARSNLSLLLPFATYRWQQCYRRLKWLNRKEERF